MSRRSRDHRTLRHYRRGDVIFSEGDLADRLFVLERGWVLIRSAGPDGREVVLGLRGPGEVLGELSVLDGKPRSATAVAAGDAELHVTPGAVLKRTLASDHGADRGGQPAQPEAGARRAQPRRLPHARGGYRRGGPRAPRAEHPGLVLMDVQLAGMDGLDALARLRADRETAAIPVLAITAFAIEEDRRRFRSAGFDGYLEKPLNVRELPDHVAALVGRGVPE